MLFFFPLERMCNATVQTRSNAPDGIQPKYSRTEKCIIAVPQEIPTLQQTYALQLDLNRFT